MKLLHHVAAALSPARLGQIVDAVAAEPRRWSDVVRFDAGRRWYQRLDLADDYEIWLLTWMPGQSTGFHDHGDAAGAFAVAQGGCASGRSPPRGRSSPTVWSQRAAAGRSARSTCTTWPTCRRAGHHRPCLLTAAHRDAPVRADRLRPGPYRNPERGAGLVNYAPAMMISSPPPGSRTIDQVLSDARVRLGRLDPQQAQRAAATAPCWWTSARPRSARPRARSPAP